MLELSPQPTPIQSLYDWYRSGILIVNRTYQRKLVWTLEEKQKLIDSILNQYPIPLILLAERRQGEQNEYELIDGLQRLHTIVSFIENEFSLVSGEVFDVEQFVAAKNQHVAGAFTLMNNAKKITPTQCSKILNYVISLSIMRNGTEAEVYDVFNRINSYGHRLSEQERRQAGLVTELSCLVRKLSCEIRGDTSDEILPLFRMPEISIDLPKSKQGYIIKADQTFWVKHGILRSTDLRDSMDEHLISDIIACVVNGGPIERSKQALDDAYNLSTPSGKSIDNSLKNYGKSNISDEIKFIISEIEKIVNTRASNSLRTIIFKNKNTNAYPTVFATICLALHNIFFKQKKNIVDYKEVFTKIENIATRIKTGVGATSEKERKKNISAVVGILAPAFIDGDVSKDVYGHPSTIDFENLLRQSPAEHAAFEFKQGLLTLDKERKMDQASLTKIINTICAIANCGPKFFGHIFIGVCDEKNDADRINKLDGTEYLDINGRYIVGIDREASIMKKGIESYNHIIRNSISTSKMSDSLKGSVTSCLSIINYYGRNVVHIGIPPQSSMSWIGDETYFRDGDQTKTASGKKIAELSSRFTT